MPGKNNKIATQFNIELSVYGKPSWQNLNMVIEYLYNIIYVKIMKI